MDNPARICPSCGLSLVADRVLEIDGFKLDPRGMVEYDGKLLDLTRQGAAILHAVATVSPRPISRPAVMARCTGSDNLRHIASIQLTNLRRALREADAPFPLETIGYTGMWRWNATTPHMAVRGRVLRS